MEAGRASPGTCLEHTRCLSTRLSTHLSTRLTSLSPPCKVDCLTNHLMSLPSALRALQNLSDILKEIRGTNGALEPICRLTLAILNTIKVLMVSLLLLRSTDRRIQDMDSNKEVWNDALDTIHKHHGIFVQQLHLTSRDRMKPFFDPKLHAAIKAYAR
jgi:hypothetical protein